MIRLYCHIHFVAWSEMEPAVSLLILLPQGGLHLVNLILEHSSGDTGSGEPCTPARFVRKEVSLTLWPRSTSRPSVGGLLLEQGLEHLRRKSQKITDLHGAAAGLFANVNCIKWSKKAQLLGTVGSITAASCTPSP